MKKILIFFTFFLLSTNIAFANSSYVLPYPSAMPGGINYKLHVVWEKILQYWYFGDFGKFEYNLKESDKYLVEAKTLFEYNQYLLGFTALQKSNDFFAKTLPSLQKAQKDGKDTADSRKILSTAAAKHIEVLQKMLTDTPATFTWAPEKTAASTLNIHVLIQTAIEERQKDL